MDKVNELTQNILVNAATMNTDAIYSPQKSLIRKDINRIEANLKELKSLIKQQNPDTIPGFLLFYIGDVTSPKKHNATKQR